MKRFSKILYIHNHSAQPSTALARLASLAANNQAEVCIATTQPDIRGGFGLPPGGPTSAILQSRAIADAKRDLRQMLSQTPFGQTPRGPAPELRVLVGDAYIQIIRAVLRDGFDLVIKPAENPSWISRLFGTTDMQLLRECPCPVWLMREPERDNYRCIVAAIDFDPQQPESAWQGINQQILELASSLALSDFASLHLLHAWEAPGEIIMRSHGDLDATAILNYVEQERLRQQDIMERVLQWLKQHLGEQTYAYLKPQVHLLQGDPSRLISAQAKRLETDLLVMGSLARAGISGLFIGNTAETILEQIQSSVLTVKPEGFVTPVTLEH
ncbi:MAG: universal stress protein [Gammaproteobacteria bacterium SHHR-1]|uniref:universal stress protein n=1 Tax=Magnetovirga frankeli TaxID=947516 RepID=UPI001293E079|nr:universal stress protein [gamma proteobacterium SS-5]